MKDSEFKILDPVAEKISENISELISSDKFNEIKELLRETIKQMPENYSLSLNIDFAVFDNKKERSIKLLQTGIWTSGGEPYQHYGDSAPVKYMVDGEMCIVPEEYCPHCWGDWGFKFKNTTCNSCGYELGKQVKYLLDDDTCPHCQDGTVTISNPVCNKCGYKVEKDKVVWG